MDGSSITPLPIPVRRTWTERNAGVVSSLACLCGVVVTALSGHLVEVFRLVLLYGWQAVALATSIVIAGALFRVLEDLRMSLLPLNRGVQALIEYTDKETGAHARQEQILTELVDRLSDCVDAIEARQGVPPFHRTTKPPRH